MKERDEITQDLKEKNEASKNLLRALMKNDPKKMSEALYGGADIDHTPGYSLKPFRAASDFCGLDIVERLIMLGAKVNLRNDEGWTPLIGQMDVSKAKLLLMHRADVDARDGNGRTALHHAAYFEDEKLIHLLHENKADFTLRSSSGNTVDDEARSIKIKKDLKEKRLEQEALKQAAAKMAG